MTRTKKLLHTALDFAPGLVLLLLLMAFGMIDERIVSRENLLVVLLQATPIALLGMGVFWILLIGEIDLSAGHAVTLSAVVMGSLLSSGTELTLALIVGFAVCLLVAACNAFLIAVLRIPSFIATLATMLMVQGATLIVATTGTILILHPALRAFGGFGQGGIIPPTILFVLCIATASWWLSRQTSFGLKTYAVGSHATRSQLAGISIGVQKFGVFLLSSVYIFFAAAVIIARVPVVNPGVGGTSLLLDAIAAGVIGGTSLMGGRGSVAGVVCGAITISLLTAALRVLGIEPSSLDLFKGLIIILILLSDRGFTLARSFTNQRTHVRPTPG